MTGNNKLINHIKIAAINTNSIIAHYRRLELLQFLKKYNHDIVLLSETKLNHKHKIIFNDYEILRTDRLNAIQGGGTAIIIKKNLPFEPTIQENKITQHHIIYKIIFLLVLP